MLKNYLKIALRHLWKHKLFSGINIFGLGAAIGASLLLMLTALQQFSFDSFHLNGPYIYRAYLESYRTRGLERGANMPNPLQPIVEEEAAGIEHAVRWRGGRATVEYGGERYQTGIRYTDPAFFEMFSFKLLEGDPARVLASLNSLVLSESEAVKFFGAATGILGRELKVIVGGMPKNLQVTGVVQDKPYTSSLNYEMITRYENAPDYLEGADNWNNFNHALFLQLKEEQTPQAVEQQLAPITQKYFSNDIERIEQEGASAPDGGPVLRLKLQPLHELHFDRDVSKDGISRAFPIGLLIGAFFILGIACINFINLTLGSSITRAREVGVRKVLGASRRQLAGQFWGEALLVAGLALVLGLALSQLLLPGFNRLFRVQAELNHPHLFLSIALILAGIGLLGGGYPALALSRFQAAEVLKGDTRGQRPGRLRNLLVLAQFAISVLLISCTIIIGQQLQYLRHKPLGFNKEEVVSIPLPTGLDAPQALERLRNELAANPRVKSISAGYNNFGLGMDGSIYTSVISFTQDDREYYTHWQVADYGFTEALEIPLVEGRGFSKDHPTDTTQAILINETFARQLGEGPYVGKVLETDPRREVIGVMKDFNFQSLEKPIEPLSVALASPGGDFPMNYIFVRISPDEAPATMQALEASWKATAPQAPFMASFLNENTNRLYRVEEVMGQLFFSAAALAIILSCMGLFGIAVLAIGQRTKEIGIRKVLGASVAGIVGLLSRDFLKMAALAILVAAPLAWLAMRAWLNNYAYRIDIQWWVFLLAGAMAVLIAFFTLSLQSVRAARANPVEALRSE
ncbi:MAG: ABC transporter permease [Lewinellaceae bacterium]|nr:ABC transporter permease [Phaeodactylibacter sp.]MCB9036669.1 ABC transporter permease [Lewinellaceae bacterium]